MQIETTRFGALTLDESRVITFPDGLPGFEDARRFAFVPHREATGDTVSMFEWLQSVDDGALAFLAMEPRHVFPGYAPPLPCGDLCALALDKEGSSPPRLYALLTVPKNDPCGITANLMAPVVVNPGARLGRQVIVGGDEYSLRHRLLAEETS